ncbi:MAG: TetR/AcrR family transcriptional regulator [Bacteroidetes bacterium]|nr:TetR/AcrR family transcriptional regulator [Bacteroidota bacterium]
MTDKQKSILESALTLFSEKGYSAVSTSLISKQANVSEGLIFRHFKDKQGLLNHLVSVWNDQFQVRITEIRSIEKPEQRIQAVMEMPFLINESDFPYWKLVFSLRWQNSELISEYMLILKEMLEDALKELKYTDAVSEADLIMAYFDGFISTVVLRNDQDLSSRLLHTLKKKYV